MKVIFLFWKVIFSNLAFLFCSKETKSLIYKDIILYKEKYDIKNTVICMLCIG